MTNITILGDGPLGRSIESALRERGGTSPRVAGRPLGGRHDASALRGCDVLVDASVGAAVARNVEDAASAGCRRFLLAATGWQADRERVAVALRRSGAAAVAAPNLSLGAAVLLRLTEQAGELLGRLGAFDPYVVEWHRRGKRDRPSGTALELVRRLGGDVETASVRAGASPGMHLVGFDSPGETIELRLTARDRSAYAAGAVAAVDWLLAEARRPGLHHFDAIVDDLVRRALPATA